MRKLEHGAIFLLYLAGACLFTWPVALQLKNFYLGAGGELGGWLWRAWWYGESLRVLAAAHPPLPFLLSYVFSAGCYPEAGNVVDLYLFSYPLTALFGNPAAYNVKGLLVLALNGYCGFLLARGLGVGRTIAVVCGALFAFNTYTAWTIAEGRIRQGILCFAALYVLYLFKAMREGGMRNFVLAGLFLGLNALIYWFYGLFAVLFAAVFVPAWLLTHRGEARAPRLGRGLAVVALVALVISFPFLTPYIRQVAKHEPLAEVQWFQQFPEPGAPMTNPQRVQLMNSRSVDFLVNPNHRHSFPLPLVLLAAVPLLVRRLRRDAAPWLCVLLFFYLMSLGPYLHVGVQERLATTPSGGYVPLPFAFFYRYFPLFSRIFNPFHFVSLVALSLAMLAGMGLGVLTSRLRPRSGVGAIFWLLLAGAYFFPMARLGQAPLPMVKMDVPPFYRSLAAEPFCGIVELPLGADADMIHFSQITHRKKILRGWADGALPDGFPPSELQQYFTMEDQRENAFVEWLFAASRAEAAAPAPSAREGLEKLKARGYRYLLVHERACFMQDPAGSTRLFDGLCAALAPLAGLPEMQRETSWEFRPDPGSRRLPTKGVETTWRLAVFRI